MFNCSSFASNNSCAIGIKSFNETYLNFDDLKWRYISDVTSLNAFCINRMRNIFHVPGHRVKHELRKILRAVTKNFSYHKRENSMMLSI